ncbi:DUF1963 domain-containing protein [Nocardiopsis sp. NPDC006938]|uniref:DUF1963 domain-containing protein n=1 Tax=Nocardiopsis sp. NPDC006938 TaxID=3364337 RepID=UPI00367F63EB
MHSHQTYRDAARAKGVPEHAIDLALSLALPQAELSPDHADTGVPVGRYGGLPALPEGVEWDSGLDLVATVDCAALPADACDLALPRDGHLLFFASRTDPDGFALLDDSRSVIHVPAGTPTTERPVPDDEEHFPALESRPLYARTFPCLPDTADDAVLPHPEVRRLFDEYRLQDHDQRLPQWDDTLHLGGYAYSPQDPPIMGSSPEDEKGGWALLAQAQLDMPDDPGFTACVFWIIQRDELAAGNFAAAGLVSISYH